MKKIAVSTLKPGMTFTDAVYIEDNNLLVTAGVPLRDKDLNKLKSWGISEVATNGEISNEGEEHVDSRLAPANADIVTDFSKASLLYSSLVEAEVNKAAYRIYLRLIERLNSVFICIAKGVALDTHILDEICSQLLQSVRDERHRFIGFILGGEVKGCEMAKSSVNTAILSALISQELKLPHHKLLHIVTGALLHDAGMLRLPKAILDKRGGLSEAERERMKSHPLLAHKIVTQELPYPDGVGDIVLQHHERWDGEGYPYHIAKDNIDVGARIVSIADAFEAMVSPKPYRNSMVGYLAIKNLLADNSHRFDPEILKAFVLTMGVHPIGSVVRLNNNIIARVVEVRASAPLRPKVQILVDEGKQIFQHEDGKVLDLLIEKNLYIAKAIDVKELANYV